MVGGGTGPRVQRQPRLERPLPSYYEIARGRCEPRDGVLIFANIERDCELERICIDVGKHMPAETLMQAVLLDCGAALGVAAIGRAGRGFARYPTLEVPLPGEIARQLKEKMGC